MAPTETHAKNPTRRRFGLSAAAAGLAVAAPGIIHRARAAGASAMLRIQQGLPLMVLPAAKAEAKPIFPAPGWSARR